PPSARSWPCATGRWPAAQTCAGSASSPSTPATATRSASPATSTSTTGASARAGVLVRGAQARIGEKALVGERPQEGKEVGLLGVGQAQRPDGGIGVG